MACEMLLNFTQLSGTPAAEWSNGGERGGGGRDDEGEKGEGTRAMRVRRNREGNLGGRADARRVREKTCKKKVKTNTTITRKYTAIQHVSKGRARGWKIL